MGENPAAEGGKSRELLLAVLPWPEADLEKEIKDIKEEFPEYDFHYISEKFTEKVAERGKLKVPEGNDKSSKSDHSFFAGRQSQLFYLNSLISSIPQGESLVSLFSPSAAA